MNEPVAKARDLSSSVYEFKKAIYKKTSFTFATIEFTCIRRILIDSRSEADIDCRQSKQTETVQGFRMPL